MLHMKGHTIKTEKFFGAPGVWLVIIFTVIVSIALLYFIERHLEEMEEQTQLSSARAIVNAVSFFQQFYTIDIIERLKNTDIKVSHQYKEIENSIPLPATMAMELGKFIKKKSNNKLFFRMISDKPFPWRKDRVLDDFEKAALSSIRSEDGPFYQFEKHAGSKVLRYAQGVVMSKECVKCHNSHKDTPATDWKVNDLRGLMVVSIPLVDRTYNPFSINIEDHNDRNDFINLVVVFTGTIGFALTMLGIMAYRNWRSKERIASLLKAEAIQNVQLEKARLQVEKDKMQIGAILDTVFDAIITINSKGIIRSLNPATERIFGYQSDEILGQNVTMLMPEPYHSEHDEYLAHFKHNSESNVIGGVREVKGQRKDGSIMTLELSVNVFDMPGQRMFTGSLRDITQRKCAEEALINSEKHLRATIEAALDCIIVINEAGLIIEFNPAAETTFGFSRGDVLGKPVSQVIIPERYQAKHESGLLRYLKTGQSEMLGKRVFVNAKRADGTEFQSELAIKSVKSTQGTIFVAYLRDITEQKKAEKEIHKLALLTEQSVSPVLRVSAEGEILYSNPASDHIIKEWNTVLGEKCREYAKEAQLKKSKIEAEMPCVDDIYQLTFQPVPNQKYVNIYAVNITERIRTSEELKSARDTAEKASQAKTEFLAMMSHEIRTPLNAVMGILGLLQDTELGSQERNYVDIGYQSAESLLHIINDILDFSKMEAGKLELEIDNFDPVSLISNIRDIMGYQAHVKDIILTTDVSDDLPELLVGDPGRIRQILLNMTSNAVKFTENGRVTLRCYLREKTNESVSLYFEVQDTGIGIPLNMQDKLFSKFTTVDASYSRKFGGTGLGLVISKKLVILMGGNIGFTSQPDEGSTFWFSLPVALGTEQEILSLPDQSSSSCENKIADRKISHEARILVAEDSSVNAMVIRNILENQGFKIEVAANGLEAVEAVHTRPFDAVLMDVAMPEMDGFEATAVIRGMSSSQARIPIIAMTAHALKGYREKVIEGGMDDYLTKPLNKKQLVDTLLQWTDSSNNEESPEEFTLSSEDVSLIDEKVLKNLGEDTMPELIPEMIARFIKELLVRLKNIADARENKDIEALKFESHTLGSSAGTFGALRLHQLARKVEALCLENNKEEAFKLIGMLGDVGLKTVNAFRYDRISDNTLIYKPDKQ